MRYSRAEYLNRELVVERIRTGLFDAKRKGKTFNPKSVHKISEDEISAVQGK